VTNALLFRIAFPGNTVEMARTSLEIHVYQPITCEQDDLSTGESKDDVIAATVTELPCIEWDSLWDRYKPSYLHYEITNIYPSV
jgi:hypothetical protein